MSNIDEEAKNNFTIEMRIFENYEKVKHEIIKVIDFLRHAETNLGMCRIFFCEMNARDVFILWLLCMLCLGMPLTCVEIFVCVFKAFLGNALEVKSCGSKFVVCVQGTP